MVGGIVDNSRPRHVQLCSYMRSLIVSHRGREIGMKEGEEE